jgi:HemY protein
VIEQATASAAPSETKAGEPSKEQPKEPAQPVATLVPAAAPQPSPLAQPASNPASSAPPPESPLLAAPAPLFRTRADIGKAPVAPISAVIPIVRAPDDPGIDDDAPADEFTEQIGTPKPKAQAGGWRGFWSRWAG